MSKGLIAGGAAAIIGLPLLVVLAVAGSGTPAAASTVCTLSPASPSPTAPSPTGASPGTSVTGSPAGASPSPPTAGPPAASTSTTLSGAQVADAQTIIGGAKALGLSEADARSAAVIAIMTARQESTITNEANPNVPVSLTVAHEGESDGKNLDSIGLFQQRPSVGSWGTTEQIMMPAHAAAAFYGALLSVPGWQALPAWQAAQDVQVSGDGTLYAKWAGFAAGVVDALYDGSASGLACATVAAGNGTDLPAGAPATGLAAEVIAFAVAQEGKPYSWGASGPAAFDCSGLVVAAFGAAGTDLSATRTSEAMWAALPHIPDASLEPGDLVFFNPGEDGVPGPGHVGIYTGDGTMINATHPGDEVRVSEVAGFGTYLGAARVPAAGPAASPSAVAGTA